MRAKRLEAILASERNLGEAEMVQRFQSLRAFGLLPVSRGRNAEDIDINGVVAGILSIVAERPSLAGTQAIVMRGLLPVGGDGASFAKAPSFGSALRAALDNGELLDTVLEVRMTDSEVYNGSHARASIAFCEGGSERTAYYVQSTAVSLLQPGSELKFNPRETWASIIHETALLPQVLKSIMREYRESEEMALIMAVRPEIG